MRRHAMGLFLFFTVSTGVALTLTTAPDAMGQAPATAKSGAAAAPSGSGKSATKAAASASGSAATAAAPTAASTGVASGTSPPAGATASPGTPGPAVPIPDKTAMDGATYGVRLRDLEAKVDELKDQIRRSHTRLALLSDTILTGGAAGSRAEVVFHNEMSSAFRLVRALFVIDGAVQYNRADDSGALADQKEIPIFQGSIPPGDHTVQVVLNFQGNGYGVFTYLRGYKFEVKSAHSFTSVEGKTLSLVSTALEKGGVTTPLEQRPTIEWQEKINALGGPGVAAPPPGGGGGASGSVKTQSSSNGGSASGSISIGGGK